MLVTNESDDLTKRILFSQSPVNLTKIFLDLDLDPETGEWTGTARLKNSDSYTHTLRLGFLENLKLEGGQRDLAEFLIFYNKVFSRPELAVLPDFLKAKIAKCCVENVHNMDSQESVRALMRAHCGDLDLSTNQLDRIASEVMLCSKKNLRLNSLVESSIKDEKAKKKLQEFYTLILQVDAAAKDYCYSLEPFSETTKSAADFFLADSQNPSVESSKDFLVGSLYAILTNAITSYNGSQLLLVDELNAAVKACFCEHNGVVCAEGVAEGVDEESDGIFSQSEATSNENPYLKNVDLAKVKSSVAMLRKHEKCRSLFSWILTVFCLGLDCVAVKCGFFHHASPASLEETLNSLKDGINNPTASSA